MKDKHVGVYWMLLMDEWMSGPLENDLDALADFARSDTETVEAVLDLAFELTSEGWVNERLEEIRAEQIAKHNRRSAAGKQGGRPRKPDGSNPQQEAKLKEDGKQCLNQDQAPLNPRKSQAKARENRRGEERIGENRRGEESEREKTRASAHPHTHTHAPEAMISFLGAEAEQLVTDFCERTGADTLTLKGLWDTFNPAGVKGSKIFELVPEEDHPAVMISALYALISENGQTYQQNFFEKVLEGNAAAFRPDPSSPMALANNIGEEIKRMGFG